MQSTERPGPGRRLGRYELLRLIGEGGMAQVWAARMDGPRGFQKVCAVKTLIPALASDPQFQRMFLDEANLAAKVRHRNVVEIYELGDADGALFLVMEWIDGQSLQRLLRPGKDPQPLRPVLAARVLADAAAGLHAAHELTDERGRPLGIVHRDVCPQNILIDRDGTVKVADFGIVKAIERLGDTTQTGEIKGKGEYMSPEQARSLPVDRRADVFSLGIVLFEAVTGVRPFQGAHDIVVMQQIATADPPRPSSVFPACPPELEWIILTALAREPDRRFPTAAAMGAALEQFMERGAGAVTSAHVAEVLRARCGARMDEVRQRIAAASQGGARPGVLQTPLPVPALPESPPFDPAGGARPAPGTPVASSLAVSPQPSPPVGAQPARPVALSSLVAAVSIGVAAAAVVFVAVSRRGEAPAAAAGAPSAAGGAGAPRPVAVHGAPIAVRVLPSSAVVRLQGAVIGVGDQLIARPAPGATLSIEARADGFAAKKIELRNGSPARVELQLEREIDLDPPGP